MAVNMNQYPQLEISLVYITIIINREAQHLGKMSQPPWRRAPLLTIGCLTKHLEITEIINAYVRLTFPNTQKVLVFHKPE